MTTPERRTGLFLAETAGDVILVVVAGFALVIAVGWYVSWWVAAPLAVLFAYGLVLQARVRRAMRKR
jgi:hypothetical protein